MKKTYKHIECFTGTSNIHRTCWRTADNLFHREDGPAIIYCTGYVCWYYNGKFCSFEEWCKLTNKDVGEIVYLKLKYPKVIT